MEQTTANQLIDDLQAVIRDAENLLRATAAQGSEKFGEKIQEIRAKTEETVRQAKGRLADVEQDALKRAEALANDANEFVRANPWQAVGLAAGVGLLIGLLVSRR
jgi:ElaB/YqjD/DUF883 family membrane-anchored ribosome-binding protein